MGLTSNLYGVSIYLISPTSLADASCTQITRNTKEGKDRGVLDKMEFAVDDTLDAVDRGANSLVGGVKRAVSKYVQLEDPPSA